jgi:ribose transport system substrate-binding protein
MKRMALGMAACLLACSCGSGGKRQFVVAFSQANNAEPYRAAQNALMTKLWGQSPDVKLVISDAQQDNSRQVAQV